MPRLILDGELTVCGADSRLVESIRKDNTYPNPARAEAERHGRPCHHLPRLIQTYREVAEGLIVSRGYLGDLLRVRLELYVAIQDRRTTALVGLTELDGVSLRDYQSRSVQAAVRYEQGIIQAPTGAGKTIIGLELLRRQGQRALILLHSRELLRQWREEIRRLLRIEAGIVGGGQWIEGEAITLAMLQTLSRNPERTRELAKGYRLVLVDECHHIPAQTFGQVMAWMPCKYRYGLTATPHRRDGLHVLIHRVMGRTLARINQTEVQDMGGIVPAEIQVIDTGFDPGYVDGWGDFLAALTGDPSRNALIAGVARKHASKTPTLILTDRVEHAEALGRVCPGSVVAHGQMGAQARRDAFSDMQSASLTIGTTGLLGEGLDISRWAALVLATPISSRVRLLQAVGRVIRPETGKAKALIVDLADDHGLSGSSLNKRLTIYRERGYTVNRIENTTREVHT